MTTRDTVEKIKSSIDIVEYIGRYVELKKAGDNIYSGQCPFGNHNDSEPSFFVYEKDQTFYCFGCGAGKKEGNSLGSDIIAFVRMISNVSFKEALDILAKEVGIEIEKGQESKELLLSRKYYKALWNSKKAMEYLLSREITESDIKTWRLGYCDSRNRLVIPILNEIGQTVGFSYRSIDDEKPKYINSHASKIFKKGSILYGMNIAKSNIKKTNQVIVTEGFFDVISAHRYGLNNVVGIMGSVLTNQQIEIIKKYASNVILALDKDATGNSKTHLYIESLSKAGLNVLVLNLSNVKDLDEYCLVHKYNVINEVQSNIKYPHQWIIEDLLSMYIKDLISLRKDYMNRITPVLSLITDKVELATYIERINLELGIPSLDLINKIKEK
jgi:DNA primase